jgi:teichuronic acid biosynthesis glycosyltransferase TuaC
VDLTCDARMAFSIKSRLPCSGVGEPLMRILTFTSLFPNANRPVFGLFVFQRISHLARRPGNLVRVVAPVPYFPSWIPSKRWGLFAQIPDVEMIGDLETHHPRYPLLPGMLMPLHGLLMFLGCFLTVRRLHRQIHFDCIDSHYVYPDGFAAVLLGKILGLPVAVTARGTDINVFPSFPSIRPMILWTLRQAAGIIAVSEALKNIMTNLGVPAKNIAVIPNGVDAERFGVLKRAEARHKLGLPLRMKIALSVGSLTDVKNHALLISAFAKVLQVRPEIRLYILGEGPLLDKLEELTRKLHMEEKVFLLGSRPNEELAAWFNAADVSCLSSSREGWPNVVMESLACGTPVVATRVGGVPEIIVSPELGVLVEKELESLAAGLQFALSKDWDRNTLVQHAHARDWDQVASQVEQCMDSQVIGRTSGE